MTLKKHLSAAVCVLLCVLLLCSCGQGAAPSPGTDPVPEEPTEQSSDEAPVPAENGGTEEPASSETVEPAEPAEEELPAAYDPRPEGTSAVREQQWGICWAMAGISTMESALIRQKLADPSIQLSTEDVLWWANVNERGGWASQRRNDGGYSLAVCGYLTTAGARSLQDIPDLGKPSDPDDVITNFYGEGENQRPENYDTAPVLFEATGVAFYENPTMEEIKRAILACGAVGTTMCDDPEMFNEETAAQWQPWNELSSANHAVSIVGWDDAFPKESFLPARDGSLPEKDGAWLIKNSYGTSYGSDGGFLHVSYEDGYVFNDLLCPSYAVASAAAPTGDKRHMLDEFGPVNL